MADERHSDSPAAHDELIDRLIALIAIARLAGNSMTVKLLEMALINEIGVSDQK